MATQQHLYRYIIRMFLDGDNDNFGARFEILSSERLNGDIETILDYIRTHFDSNNGQYIPCSGRGLVDGVACELEFLHSVNGEVWGEAQSLCDIACYPVTLNNPYIDSFNEIQIF